jgi:hypothetical protein
VDVPNGSRREATGPKPATCSEEEPVVGVDLVRGNPRERRVQQRVADVQAERRLVTRYGGGSQPARAAELDPVLEVFPERPWLVSLSASEAGDESTRRRLHRQRVYQAILDLLA